MQGRRATRIWTASLALALAAGLAAPAAAEGVATREEGAQKVTLFGHVMLDWVCRDELFEAVFPRRGPLPVRPNDEQFGDFLVRLGFDATLDNKFGAMLVLETNADAYGAESHRMGDNLNTVHVEEAYLYAKQFGSAKMPMEIRLGVQSLRAAFRETRSHGSFFLDLHGSEDPFTMAAHTSSTAGLAPTGVNASQSGIANGLWGAAGAAYYVVPGFGAPFMTPDATLSPAGFNPYLGGNAWVNNLVGQSKRSEFGGASLSFELMKKLELQLFAGTTMESGTARADTQVWGAMLTSRFQLPGSEQDSLVRFTYTTFASGGGIAVHSGGVSVEFVTLNDMFFAYGEFVGQGGVYTNADRAGLRDHTPQKSWGWYSGGRIEVPVHMLGLADAATSGQVLFLDGSFWHLSGDDGNPFQANEDFVSFESVQSGLLLEGAQYGFDIDTNYHAVKVEAGLNVEWMSLSFFWGHYALNHAPIGNVGSTAAIRQQLGNEFDLRLRFMDLPVDNVEIGLALAFLSQADFFRGLTRERNRLEFGSGNIGDRDHLTRALLCILSVKVRI